MQLMLGYLQSSDRIDSFTLKGCNPIKSGYKFTSEYGTQSTVHDGENFFPLYFHLCDALIRLSWIEVDYGYWAPIIWLILEIPEIWTFVIVTDQSELRQI